MISSFLQTFSKPPMKHLAGFEDVLLVSTNANANAMYLLNTLPSTEQSVLIHGTLEAVSEETVINRLLEEDETCTVKIVLYGKNTGDTTVWEKQAQLTKLGFTKVYVYSGGLFEWLLLQEVYGKEAFPTTGTATDLLKYRSLRRIDADR